VERVLFHANDSTFSSVNYNEISDVILDKIG